MTSMWQLVYIIPLYIVLSSYKVQYVGVCSSVNTGYGVYTSNKTRNTLSYQGVSCFWRSLVDLYVNLRGKSIRRLFRWQCDP